jgi:uridine kinase
MKNYNSSTIAKKIVDSCINQNKRFLFISGNGGSGKTELSKIISNEAAKYGHVNVLDVDDFVVDTKLRNNATIIYNDINLHEQKGRYTTSVEASYFLQNIKAIIYNIEKGNNYYHWPKKAKTAKECRLLYGNATLTIIEGVGTVFLEQDKQNSISIFIEIIRRTQRAKFSNEKDANEVRKNFEERNNQYKSNIEPHIPEYDIILESIEDFSLNIIKDDFHALQ